MTLMLFPLSVALSCCQNIFRPVGTTESFLLVFPHFCKSSCTNRCPGRGKESALFWRNIGCSLVSARVQSMGGGDHPAPFSLLGSETPASFSLFLQSTYWVFCSCFHLRFFSAPCREAGGLAAGKGPVLQPHCLTAVARSTETAVDW